MLRRMVRAADPPPPWEADIAVDGRSQSVASSRDGRRVGPIITCMIDASAMKIQPAWCIF